MVPEPEPEPEPGIGLARREPGPDRGCRVVDQSTDHPAGQRYRAVGNTGRETRFPPVKTRSRPGSRRSSTGRDSRDSVPGGQDPAESPRPGERAPEPRSTGFGLGDRVSALTRNLKFERDLNLVPPTSTFGP